MPKTKDQNVKIYEQQIGQNNTIHSTFEDDTLIAMKLIGDLSMIPIGTVFTDVDAIYDIYTALSELFEETGLDPKNKNDKKLKVSSLPNAPTPPQQ